VGYYQASNQLICPCHTSVFNLNDGSLISGPAPTGLTKLAVTEANGTLYIESV
jgi:nitrite reductase/ring-hydroxylating ferredoxin subunit